MILYMFKCSNQYNWILNILRQAGSELLLHVQEEKRIKKLNLSITISRQP